MSSPSNKDAASRLSTQLLVEDDAGDQVEPPSSAQPKLDLKPVLLEDEESTSAAASVGVTVQDNDRPQQQEEEETGDMIEKFSDDTMALVYPIVATLTAVMWAVNTLAQTPARLPLVYKEEASDNISTKAWGSLLNSLAVVGLIIAVTVVMVVLYKYRCYKVLAIYFTLSIALMQFSMGYLFSFLTFQAYSIPYDNLTAGFVLWNFAIVGSISIFYRGNLTLIQVYLVLISIMMGWSLSQIPEWTTWFLLAAVAIYDVFAVLAPAGPLKALVEESQKREEPIPGLVYESKTFKLGLGDFIFYSMLVGRASQYGYLTGTVAMVSVLMGMCATIFCLSIVKKALPALPISIALGMVMFFGARFTMVQHSDLIILNGLWI